MMPKQFYVYILASDRNGTLYTGMTNDIRRRVAEHIQHLYPGFTAKYNVIRLVYVEQHATFDSAETRERQIKTWKRRWKMRLIEEKNPEWKDLFEDKRYD